METRRSWKSWLTVLLLLGGVGVLAYLWKTGRFQSVGGTEKSKPAADAKTQDMPGMPGMKTDAAPSGSATENSIFVPPEKQQLTGMRSVVAVVKPLVKDIRIVGKVSYDETKVTHIHTKVSGYIEQVFADSVGKAVRKGDALFTIYSPDLVATQQEYLLALKSRKMLKDSSFPWIADGSDNLLDAARSRLRLWDVSEEEIQRLEKEGVVKRAIEIYSPVNGIVTERKAYHHGTFVNSEMDLFTIVDLSQVWILGDVYEYELPYVKVGQQAEVDFPYSTTAKALHGHVDFVYPFLDPKTRTAQVRLEFANPGLALKPDMFTNILLHINLGNQLVVPQDAVLNTGTEQYVFIDKGQGYVEPRLVQLGPESGDEYAIQKGLRPGEKVVTAANFLVDAESRLKGAFANMGKPSVPAAGGRQAATTQNLNVEVLEPKQAKVGGNAVRVAIHDASGQPVEGAQVEIRLFMPQMGNMAPTTSKADLQSSVGGQYTGTVDVPIAWTWQTTITIRRGDQVIGTKQLNLTAR
jgi:RND family efflux transporter MFP subunit